MLYIKFSLVGLLFLNLAHASMFSSRVCLMSSFKAEIKHDGQFFGLIKNDLSIEKDKCNITINFKEILDTRWKIDICREPVHIKMLSKGSLDVYKRDGACDGSSNQFCQSYHELRQILQDHGLIFAEGERESLESDHGKTYCSYLLINKYLGEGTLFSKYEEIPNIFNEVDKSTDVKKIEGPKDNNKKESTSNEDSILKKSNEARF